MYALVLTNTLYELEIQSKAVVKRTRACAQSLLVSVCLHACIDGTGFKMSALHSMASREQSSITYKAALLPSFVATA